MIAPGQPAGRRSTSSPGSPGRAGVEEVVAVRRRVVLVAVAAVVGVLVVVGVAVLPGPGRDPGGRAGTTAVVPAPRTPADGRGVAPVPDGRGTPSVEGAAAPGADTAPDAASGATPGPHGRPTPGVPVGGVARSLARTAQLTVEVDDQVAAARQVRTAGALAGGFVVEEQSGDGDSWIVLRVPADALDRVIEDVAAAGTVTGRSGQVVDATEEVVDLDARVASQQASVSRVRALLAQATSIGDVVAVESELARREAELDSLTGRLATLRGQVSFSTLTVDLRTPPGPVTADDGRAAGFLDGLATGWDGLRALGSAVAAVIGFLLPFVPVLALLGGVAWVIRWLRQRRRTTGAAGGRSGPAPATES